MSIPPIIERIDPALEALMERFFTNSNQDLAQMQAALDEGDFRTLARLGHTARGTGHGYGFRGMGDIGHELELAAKVKSADGCAEQIRKMAQYLDVVEVKFGE